jgi:hypothetical protein
VQDETPPSWDFPPRRTGIIPEVLTLGAAEQQLASVVLAHSAQAKRRCSEAEDGGDASVMLHVVVDAAGRVSSARAEGKNARFGKCLEKEVKRWVFPAQGVSTRLDLPFSFVR